jgi:hypothetical protein
MKNQVNFTWTPCRQQMSQAFYAFLLAQRKLEMKISLCDGYCLFRNHASAHMDNFEFSPFFKCRRIFAANKTKMCLDLNELVSFFATQKVASMMSSKITLLDYK